MSSAADAPENSERSHPLEASAAATSSTSSDLTVSAGITYSQSSPGVWDLKRAQHELRLTKTLHDQKIGADKAAADLMQSGKDKQDRRERAMILFWSMIVGLGVFLVAGFALAIFTNDSGNREFGRGILLTIVSGVVGYVIGDKRG